MFLPPAAQWMLPLVMVTRLNSMGNPTLVCGAQTIQGGKLNAVLGLATIINCPSAGRKYWLGSLIIVAASYQARLANGGVASLMFMASWLLRAWQYRFHHEAAYLRSPQKWLPKRYLLLAPSASLLSQA